MNMRTKRHLRIVLTILSVITFFFIQMFIHELGHVFFIIITGNEFLEIKFMEDQGFFVLMTRYIFTGNPAEGALISLGGHLFMFLFFLTILYLSFHFKKPIFVNGALFSIFLEVSYLSLSSILLYGDLYNFSNKLNLPILILQILSILFLILSLFLFFSLIKYNYKNVDYYITPYYETKKYI